MISIDARSERWKLLEPFEIAGKIYTEQPVVLVTLKDAQGNVGRGEAAGVDYDGETVESMLGQIAALEPRLRQQPSAEGLLNLLPKGGARNALDCALWDLRAKRHRIPAWRMAGLSRFEPAMTAVTIGLCGEADLRRKAQAVQDWPVLKLKVDAERHVDVVRIVREHCPHAQLLIDANQSWSRALLEGLVPRLHALDVRLIEQPVPQGEDEQLDGFRATIPLAADESCRDRNSLPALVGRYQYASIKLDKCGGLTEALAMVRDAKRLGLGLMVGNMCGTSLAMAPAMIVAQHCRYVDLDGPLLQRDDRSAPLRYRCGVVSPPVSSLWG